jgi:hypothetical protein
MAWRIVAALGLLIITGGARSQALSVEELQLLQPQQTNEGYMKAKALARRLGEAASAPGLAAILERSDEWRLGDYAYGYSSRPRPVLPAEIEALMVRHFNAAPNHRFKFTRMITEGRSKYRTEDLRRLLLSALSSSPDSHKAILVPAIVNTDLPGLEAPLLEQVSKVPRSAAYYSSDEWQIHVPAVQFFGQRGYAPAVPYVSVVLRTSRPNSDVRRSEATAALAALVRIDANAAVVEGSMHFERLTREPQTNDAQMERLRAFELLRQANAPFTVGQLAGLLRDRRPNDPLAQSVVRALLAMPQKEAVDAVLERMKWVGRQTEGWPLTEVEATLAALTKLPAPSPLDLARLREAMPPVPNDTIVGLHMDVIGRRREGVADLIAYLTRAQPGTSALERLIAFESPDVWREARAGLEQLHETQKISPERYAYARARLDDLIGDPEKYFAAKRAQQLAAAFQDERGKLDRFRIAANRARKSHPATYVEQMEQWLAGLEALQSKYAALPAAAAVQSERSRAWLELATHARFVEKRPDKAVALCEKAAALPRTGAFDQRPFIDILIADVYQFDLSAPGKALERYETALQGFEKMGSSSAEWEGTAQWWTTWLRTEIEYLKTGKRFTGTLTRDDAIGFFFAAFLLSDSQFGAIRYSGYFASLAEMAASGDPSKIDRTRMAAALNELAPSRLHLFASVRFLSLLADEKQILDFLARHDRSGHLSARFLGAVPYVDRMLKDEEDHRSREFVAALLPGLGNDARDSALRRASERFLKDRGIRLSVAAVDSRRSNPEATWKLFIGSLRQGDLQTAYGCLTSDMRAKLEPRLSGMRPQDLRAMADSFSELALTESSGQLREGLVRRGDRAGFVYFIRVDGEWKIQEM